MIVYKSLKEIEKIRAAGAIVAKTLKLLFENIRPGITTAELDRLADEFIRSQDAVPSFKGYNGYPASICVSIDHEVVHGIPGKRTLRDGQVVGIDVGAYKNGYHGDSAWTAPVGKINDGIRKHLEIGQECEPQVPHYGKADTGLILKPGLVIAIEPMINEGVYQVRMLNDNWTIVTADGRRSVHFEHTVAVLEDGPEILTK